jgi:hypothetical protein
MFSCRFSALEQWNGNAELGRDRDGERSSYREQIWRSWPHEGPTASRVTCAIDTIRNRSTSSPKAIFTNQCYKSEKIISFVLRVPLHPARTSKRQVVLDVGRAVSIILWLPMHYSHNRHPWGSETRNALEAVRPAIAPTNMLDRRAPSEPGLWPRIHSWLLRPASHPDISGCWSSYVSF